MSKSINNSTKKYNNEMRTVVFAVSALVIGGVVLGFLFSNINKKDKKNSN